MVVTLQRFYDAVEQGHSLQSDAWKGVGRKRTMQSAEMILYVNTWRLSKDHGNNTVNEHMRDYQAGLIKKSGGVTIALKDKYFCSTIESYTCNFASIAGVPLTHKSIGKART